MGSVARKWPTFDQHSTHDEIYLIFAYLYINYIYCPGEAVVTSAGISVTTLLQFFTLDSLLLKKGTLRWKFEFLSWLSHLVSNAFGTKYSGLDYVDNYLEIYILTMKNDHVLSINF